MCPQSRENLAVGSIATARGMSTTAGNFCRPFSSFTMRTAKVFSILRNTATGGVLTLFGFAHMFSLVISA